MTQRRRVRALHLASCCTLHTYSIGCTASQRNNIVTIHHTSAVNKTSGSFCHPRSSSLAALILSLPTLPFSFFLFPFYYLFPFLLIFALAVSPCLRLSAILFSRRLATPTTYSPRPPIYLIFSFLLFFPPSCRPFLRVSFSLLSPNQPPTHPYIFSINLSAPFHVHPLSPLCCPSFPLFLSFALMSRVYAGAASGKSIRVTSPVD